MTIKMRVIDWWQPDTEKKFNTNPFINLLRQKYEVIYSDTPDFVLCGPFGSAHLDYDCVKIFYTGENLRVDWNLYDYGMGFDYMDFGERYLHLPLFFIYNYDFTKRDLGERKRFCAYIVRHSGANEWGKDGGLRDRFFDKLSEYKRVDSGGGWRNNIGGAVENKGEWLKDYKFNICFENSSSPGYLTEKLFDAYNAGCVPIYWGDTSLNSSYGELNSSSGASCGDLADFGHCADSSPVLHPKSAKNSTTSTAIRRICEQSEATNTRICDSNQVDSSYSKNSPSLAEGARGWVKTHSLLDSADSQNLVKNNLARSANPCKSFCYFWLLPKVESLPLPLNPNLPNNADSANQTQNAESAPFCHPKSFSCHSKHCEESKKNPSLRADSQNLRGNPPYEKTQNLQGRLPRSHSLARNDKNLDSSLRKCSAQNDNLTQSAESSLDSADSQNLKRGGDLIKNSKKIRRISHTSRRI